MTDCGHNYCEDCLVKHVDGRTTWMCPLSRKEYNRTVSSLPRNFLIEQLVQSMTTPPPQPASNPTSHSKTHQFESCTTHERPNELRKNQGWHSVHFLKQIKIVLYIQQINVTNVAIRKCVEE